MPRPRLFCLLLLICCACNNGGKYPYAISDFREKLQPCLVSIVTKGIVMGRDSALSHVATDAELERLSRSEHPILRAAAFREIFQRKSMDQYAMLMEHLDDTALVFTDAGEFGIWDRTVSDDILREATWKTQEAKNKTIDRVLSHHNYLQSAYLILMKLPPQERYYPFVRDMATRSRHLDPYEGYELGFSDIEHALYGLARFRKKEDIAVIKDRLMKYSWRLSDVSFRLMSEFPDTAYYDVLEDYHNSRFYRFSGYRPHGFSGFPADRAAPEDFIGALAAQQTEKSARLLDSMLTNIPKHKFLPDKQSILDGVVTAIWEHPCAAYARLRERIKPKALALASRRITVPMDSSLVPFDTTTRTIRWD